ncbi:MAG: phosphoribosylanthranilate isomerase [Balneolaceae bacterium]
MHTQAGNRTAVKICGLTSLKDARFAAGALADYLGFIFFEDSPRYIEPSKAGAIINWIEGPQTVGVFVNQPLDDVNMLSRQTGIGMVQLHGTESAGYCRLIEKPVIKAFHIGNNSTPDEINKQTEPYLNHADYFLFDTRSKSLWGGTGETFDWELLKNLSRGKPFFLSGGLNSGNVRNACRSVRPFSLDLSSGVEKVPGVKDFDKVEELFDVMRDVWELQESGNL